MFAAVTRLPASICRKPTRPPIGAVTRVKDRLSFAALIAASSTFERRLELLHGGRLSIDIGPGDGVLRQQQLIAREFGTSLCELGLIPSLLAFGLCELHVEGTRIDLRQQLTALDELSFVKRHGQQLAIDPRLDGHLVERDHRSERAQSNGHVLGSPLVEILREFRPGTASRAIVNWKACSWSRTGVCGLARSKRHKRLARKLCQ